MVEQDALSDVDEELEMNGNDPMTFEEEGIGEEVEEEDSLELPVSDEEVAAPVPQQTKRKPLQTKSTNATSASAAAATKPPAAAPRKRGRPPKDRSVASAAHPAKRAKKTTARPATPEPEATGADKREATTPVQAGDSPIRRKRAPKPSQPSIAPVRGVADPQVSWPGTDRTKPRARGLRILRSETPAADVGATVMRSGRTSVKPMAFWRNERAVYGAGRRAGAQVELGGIKEVIRTEEVSPEPRARPKRRARRRNVQEAIGGDDEDVEEWELEPGFLEATVPKWDPLTGKASEEAEEEIGMR